MPHRRAPVLALVLALALVAYPVTMPLAMAGMPPASLPMSMPGGQGAGHQHQPGHQHHATNVCCAGMCASCPVVAITAEVTPRVRATTPTRACQHDQPVSTAQSPIRRLPYSIGPPPPASLA